MESDSQNTRLRTNLPDLPNELLRLIFFGFSPKDCLSLSLISRRLHFVILPVYLDYYGISNASELEKGEVDLASHTIWEVLRGLRLALFVTSIQHLSYTANPRYPEGQDVIWEVQGIIGLVKRLDRVERFTLQVYRWSNSSVDKWMEEMMVLLGLVVLKGCKSLTVLGIPALKFGTMTFHHPFPLHFSAPRVPQVLRVTKRTLLSKFALGGSGSSLERWKTIIKLIPEGPSVIRITSTIMFRNPCLLWTVAALNSSAVTTLSLDQIGMTSEEWANTLSAINLPSLAELTIHFANTYHSASFRDLSTLLVRHPSITLLDLRSSQPAPTRRPTKMLPNLTTLRTSSEYVSYFLRSSGSLNVKSVSIYVFGVVPQLSVVEATLLPVKRHLRGRLKALSIIADNPTSDWMEEGNPTRSFTADDIFSEVTDLEWRAGQPIFSISDRTHRDLLPSWLGHFPALRCLTILHQLSWLLHEEEDIKSFLNSIRERCPNIGIVEINGEKVDIRDRLGLGSTTTE